MPTLTADTGHDLVTEDLEYQRQGGRDLLARLYRPGGAGRFPAMLQVHGGAWVNKDRTDDDRADAEICGRLPEGRREVELELYEGTNHGFMTGKPDAPYGSRAIDRIKAFRKHTSG
jgi:hypothetical protein